MTISRNNTRRAMDVNPKATLRMNVSIVSKVILCLRMSSFSLFHARHAAYSREQRHDEPPATEHIFQGHQSEDSRPKLSPHASGSPH